MIAMADWPDDAWKNWLLRETKYALQALAMTEEIQTTLFPPFAPPTDELADGFLHCFELLPQLGSTVTQVQWTALRQIHFQIEQLTSADFKDSGLKNATWQKLRILSAQALDVFGWPIEPPPLARKLES
jgi:hypothetical protein